jgi:HEAT repeat protein
VCSASLLASVDPERKKDAVAVHMEALKDKDADLRISAASSLIGIDKSYKTEVVPFLIEILDKDLQPDRRAEAAMLLRECGPAAKAAVPALLRALNAKDDYTRVRVAEELLEIDPNQAGAVIPVLIELLDSADSGGEAASELSKLKLSAKDAKAALAKLLPAKNEKPSEFLPKLNRVQKLGALALLDPEDDDAIRLLVETLGDPDYVVVRSFVLRALGALGPRGKVAVPAILDVAKADESGSCTWQICQALAQIGPGAKEAIPWLNEHRKSKDGAIRKAAATALQIIDADKEKPENDLR